MYKVAIIGCGDIALGLGTKKYPMTHYKSYDLSKVTKLVALVDNDKSVINKVKAKIPDIPIYSTLSELFEFNKIDILSICSPTHLHSKHIEESSKLGVKGIWSEKPLSIKTNELYRIKKILEKKNILLEVNYFRRFISEIISLKKDIDLLKFGKLIHANGYYSDNLINNGSHLFDLTKFLLGNFKIINAYIKDQDTKDCPTVVGMTEMNNMINFSPIINSTYNIFELNIFFESCRINISENGRRIIKYNVKNDAEFTHLKILDPKPDTIICNWNKAFDNLLEKLTKNLSNNINSSSAVDESIFLADRFEEIFKLLH